MDEHRLVETFEAAPLEVARARRLVRAALGRWGLNADVPDVELLVSELVSNAVRHGRGRICMLLSLAGDRMYLDVRDGGHGSTPTVRERTDLGGRGLRIVQHLADRWGTKVNDAGTSVWARRHVLSSSSSGL